MDALNSKDIGNIGESAALYEFVKHGIPVCLPWGDNLRYDMVAEFNGKLNKIQVKTSEKPNNGAYCFRTESSYNHTTNKRCSKYGLDVDYFVFYALKDNKIAIMSIEEIGNNSIIMIRISPPKNNQKSKIRYFEDYSFDKILNHTQ